MDAGEQEAVLEDIDDLFFDDDESVSGFLFVVSRGEKSRGARSRSRSLSLSLACRPLHSRPRCRSFRLPTPWAHLSTPIDIHDWQSSGGKAEEGDKGRASKRIEVARKAFEFRRRPFFSLENRRRGRNDNKLRRQRGQSVASVPRNCKQAKHTRSRESGRAGGAAVRETRGGGQRRASKEKKEKSPRERGRDELQMSEK